MLKGHVFSKQLFENPIFALWIDTLLDKKCGIAPYKNKMSITKSGNVLTVSSGTVCIRGRFVEEDSSTSVAAGADSAYCSLVVEVNLDKTNTESELNQVSYKIIKSTNSYPTLTQTDIVKNNSGIYQYELARFKTGSGGITEFQDKRTFLDFDSIYTEIQTEYRTILRELEEELENIKDGSTYKLKEDFVKLEGNLTVTQSGASSKTISYPAGFTKNNCVVVACGIYASPAKGYNFIGQYIDSSDGLNNSFNRRLNLTDDAIILFVRNPNSSSLTVNYRIVLMKI